MCMTNAPSRAPEPCAPPSPAPAADPEREKAPASSPTKIGPVRERIPEPDGNLRRRDEAFKQRRGGPPA